MIMIIQLSVSVRSTIYLGRLLRIAEYAVIHSFQTDCIIDSNMLVVVFFLLYVLRVMVS